VRGRGVVFGSSRFLPFPPRKNCAINTPIKIPILVEIKTLALSG
jgi:hypothetical protein